MNEMKLMARKQPWSFGVELCFAEKVDGHFRVARPIEFVESTPGHHVPPAIELDETMAQRLMDELWNCGIRPSEGTGSAGSLKATQYHLEDMRRLVFKEKKP